MARYKLCFYVPVADLDAVKAAVFAAGAGFIGNYSECCWQSLGQGQFKPNSAAKPAIGKAGALEAVPEFKVELLCEAQHIEAAVAALKQAHPYEEPAYDVFALADY